MAQAGGREVQPGRGVPPTCVVATTILRGDMGPGEVQRQQQGSGGLGVAGTNGLACNATGSILLCLRYRMVIHWLSRRG